ncbi:hypothetical protein V5799_004376 [Amblyomma americanum]|uniref:Uncharacterized protein n=1 Tax=Amblyomma americanum TaxID=6943 RepID=A0AAQ4D699_AMBAM
MPYIVQDLLRYYPGLSGLFVASVFSASLRTEREGRGRPRTNLPVHAEMHEQLRPERHHQRTQGTFSSEAPCRLRGCDQFGARIEPGRQSVLPATFVRLGRPDTRHRRPEERPANRATHWWATSERERRIPTGPVATSKPAWSSGVARPSSTRSEGLRTFEVRLEGFRTIKVKRLK